MSKNQLGIIIGVQGPVVNVRFEEQTPLVHEALEIELSGKEKLILETALVIGDQRSKSPSDGFNRWINTGHGS